MIMYTSSGKPSPAKFRVRIARIRECAITGKKLSDRWNPKGRNAHLHCQLDRYFKDTIVITDAFLEELNRR